MLVELPPSARRHHEHPITNTTRCAATASALREAAPYIAAMLTAAVLGFAQLLVIDAWGQRRGADLRDLLGKWDADWLTGIADHGYLRVPGRDPFESVAFFPGYPTLVRVVAAPLVIFDVGDATFLAAMIVSITSSILLAGGLARLVIDVAQRLRPWPLDVGTRVVLSVAAAAITLGAPMGQMYWMPYSEAMFTALAVWALAAILRGRYLTAGVLVLFAGLTRLTALALIATLCAAALVELWRYLRYRKAFAPMRFPWRAVLAPVIGSVGIAAYLTWASYRTRSAGGYFAVQNKGWGSGFDWGRSSWDWLRHNTIIPATDPNSVGFAISSWSMILAAALCAVTVWPLLRRRLPWQIWVTATAAAAIVLGSGGTMHARPRLLLFATMLLLVLLAVLAIDWLTRQHSWRLHVGVASLTAAIGLWCVLGFAVSGHMLIDFAYGI